MAATPRIVVMGSANMDLVLRVDRLPRAGETISGGDLALYPGGKGANQACAAGKLGGQVTMVAQVGCDAFGAKLVAGLQAAAVDTSGVGNAERPTGCALICVLPDGENSIVVSPGANHALDVETALSRIDSIAPGDFLLGQLETPLETVEAAFAHAKRAGAITVLDPAPARPLSRALLGSVDFLTPNQSEAALLLGDPERDILTFGEAEAIAARVAALGPWGVVLKLGELGCFVRCGSFSGPVPGFAVSAVDSTGAGDVFNGAFAVALGEGRPAGEAARFANAAAAISVTRPGAQSSVPSRTEVDLFLSRNRRE